MPNLLAPGFSLSAAVTWGAADFCGGLATKQADPFHVVAVAHATGLAFMLSLAVAFREPIPATHALLWGAVGGLVGGVGLAAFYKSLAVGKMGINAPLSAVITAFVPLVFSFRTEGLPQAVQIAGFVLGLVSIWMIALPHGNVGKPRGITLAVVAGIGFGGFLLFMKLAGSRSVFWPLVSARAASTLLMSAIAFMTARASFLKQGPVGWMLLAGVLDSGANALYVAAVQRGRLDVAAVISSLYPASTVILARFFLKEHLSRTQSIGMLAALLAVVLIAGK